MALNTERLRDKIKEILAECRNFEAENSENEALEYFALKLAKAVVEEVKQATVSGTCPSSGGALTAGKIT